MRRNRPLHIWAASGNYELIEQVRLAFSAQQATVQPLFSHRDAVYAAVHQTADVLFLDDGMMDRETGMPTSALLRQMPSCPLIIRYRSPHMQPPVTDSDDAVIIVRSLDPSTLQNAYQQAFTDRQTPTPMTEKEAKYETHSGESLLWRSAEIKTLFALSRSLTEVLELGEVLNRVVEAARSLTDADEGMILLPDGESRELYLRAKVGIENEVALNFRVKTQDTLAGEVFNSGNPVLIGAQGPLKVKTQYFVNSLLYVPIILKTKVIGVLGVNNKDKYDIFSERDQELLLNLASYAAIAIENARIHGQSIKRARELKSLVDAGQDINASLSVEHTLRSICQQLQRVLNVHSAEILEWDTDARTLGTVARQIHAVWRHEAQPILPLASGSAFARALGNDTALWLDFRSASDYEGEWLTRIGSSGVWLIPVRVDGQPLALLMGHQALRDPVGDDDRFMRARGYALDALSLLREARGTPTAALNSLAEINDLLQTDWVELAVVRPDMPHHLFITLATGAVVWTQESGGQPCLSLTQYPDIEKALYQGSVINFYRAGKTGETDIGRFLSERRGASLLGIPMLGRGKTRRIAIVIDTEHAEAFATREIDLMKAIINQASTALENARLLHDLEMSLIELRETQARLIQAARLTAMGELAAAVAHQINNPLTTIVLDTELMLDQPALDTDTRETLIAISNAGKRAAGVVRRLLASIRPQSISDLPAQAVNVLETINGTVSLVRSHIEHSRIRLTTALPQSLPPVFAIPGELDDIWLNLLLNAHDALVGRSRSGAPLENGQKDEIGIWAQHDPEAAFIEIQIYDNGPGIPEAIIGEIFKPFFTTKPPGEGTGLGLHICRQTVEHVGGQMTVHSVVNQGTTFIVHLPVTGRNDR